MGPTPCVDLHMHSTASDGSRAPADVVRAAKKANLAAIALTDHDSVAGLAEAEAAGTELATSTCSSAGWLSCARCGRGVGSRSSSD